MKLILGAFNDELLVNLVLRAVPYCNHVDAAVAYADSRDHVLVRACKEHGPRGASCLARSAAASRGP